MDDLKYDIDIYRESSLKDQLRFSHIERLVIFCVCVLMIAFLTVAVIDSILLLTEQQDTGGPIGLIMDAITGPD